MMTTVVGMRYRMKEVLKALDRRERVHILYHGKTKGVIIPVAEEKQGAMNAHAFFGMHAADKRPVADVMKQLRQGRAHAV
jgi:hypothetical protein